MKCSHKAVMAMCLIIASFNISFAETFSAPDKNFSVTIPDNFDRMPAYQIPKDWYAAYKTPDDSNGNSFGISIANFPELIKNEKLAFEEGERNIANLPNVTLKSLIDVKWKNHTLQIIEMEVASPNGLKLVSLRAQIPSVPTGTQIAVVAPYGLRNDAIEYMKKLIESCECQTNWTTPQGTMNKGGIDAYGKKLLFWGIAGLVVGLAIMWVISQKTSSKSLVLIIGLVVWFVGFQMGIRDSNPTRLSLMITGFTRMFGFITTVLGIIDLIRKVRRAKKKEKELPPLPKKSWE